MAIPIPKELKVHVKAAQLAIQAGAVRDVEFSGATYQVLVTDRESGEELWVFLQLGPNGEIKDAFCSEGDQEESCLHIAIAYLSLFDKKGVPLHVRFQRCLWNKLCEIFEERFGNAPPFAKDQLPNAFIIRSRTGKTIFECKGLTKEVSSLLNKMFLQRKDETEETSLKFSGLTQDEITLWREGTPPPDLRYVLSPWSDLAKELLRREEGAESRVSFGFSHSDLPNWIEGNFGDIQVGFYLSEANLPLVVDAFKTVNSPLGVFYEEAEVEEIAYDKETETLHIFGKKKTVRKGVQEGVKKGIALNGWLFVPGKGFYAQGTSELLKHPRLHGEDIAHALSEHTREIAAHLVGCTLHTEATPLSYHLSFDPLWNLHITAYLFEVGDLTSGDAWLIGDWAYLDGDGFYRVEGNRFKGAKCVEMASLISDFVNEEREWLDRQEGFATHIRSLESQLSYQVTEAGRLLFTKVQPQVAGEGKQKDFGAWVFVEGMGFYSKASGSLSFMLRPGVSLSPDQVPLFIRANKEELELIPHFFASESPVSNIELAVELTEKNGIKVTPRVTLYPYCSDCSFKFFDDFIFVEGVGFSLLPPKLRLPQKFMSPVVLGKKEVSQFIKEELDLLLPRTTFVDARLMKPKEMQLVAEEVEPLPERGRGWYRFKLSYRTERGSVSVTRLAESIGKKQSYLFSEAGRFDLDEARCRWLHHLPKERRVKEWVIISALEFMRLNAADEVVMKKRCEAFLQLTQLKAPDQPDTGGLLSHLRPYQEAGLRWLWFLHSQRLSGLLCDDMGLGKTHQAMGLLAAVVNLYHTFAEGVRPRFLITCPTSVIYHWQDKLAEFLPGFSVHSFHGQKRDVRLFHAHCDILLTTYGTLRNELEAISQIPFEVAIFDEVQMAKNQGSLVYAALTQVRAETRIGLTGTPIENHLRELKSLFDIVLPTYMPGDKEYREMFVRPIEKMGDVGKKRLLHRLIYPFVLRRLKGDVLKDLPEKSEEIAHCNLSPVQEQLYSDLLLQRKHLLEEVSDEKKALPYLHVFSLLSSLKQICDHPAVYLKKPGDYQEYLSGKWDLFLELLREARESGQKVVVFSQYLHMLDIIEAYLTEKRIGFAALRGETQNRKEEVRRFNTDPDCEVFVGSLHAAGLGIDLTAGSVVIHYDRWWNAARENQATDRVHRIGQTRGVQVFKLMTLGTFEEKIDKMIAKKGKLLEEVVGVDEQSVIKTLTRQEIIELLGGK